jgi:hypothetical protein
VLYGLKSTEYNNQTHVMVRVLSPEELPVDLDNGLKFIENEGD